MISQSLVDTNIQQQYHKPSVNHATSITTATKEPFIHDAFLTKLNLVVNAEFHILICQLCKEGIPTPTTRSHIVNKHPELCSAFSQVQLDDVIRKLQLVASLPTAISGPRSIVHGLAIYEALACDQCSMVLTKSRKLKAHHLQCHPGMTPPQGWRTCKAQRMKPEGYGQYRIFWEVEIVTDSAQDPKEVMVAKLMEELNEELKVVQVPTDHRLVSPWLRTTRWHQHVSTLATSTEKLRTSIALPRPQTDEACCKNLQHLVECYFKEAVELIDSTDELVLQRLNSPDPTKHGISNTPFHKHTLDTTLKQYIIPIVCLLAMLLRELWIGMEQENIVISKLEDLIEEDREPSCIIQQIHVVLIKLWTTHWRKVSDRPQHISDPTEAALALLTLNEDGSFKEPKDVTKIIAKLEYCMRLTFLKEIRARANADRDNITEAIACDMLQPWFTKKTYSTFSRLRSLQHRASTIAYETMGLPRIWWTDTDNWTSLKYKGNSIAFPSICAMFQDMEDDLITTWENKVLRGLTLRVDYQDLVDDPTNTDIGYSFIFDSKNTCFRDRTRLVRAIVAGQGAFSSFLLQQDKEGELIWNHAALRGWLQDYAQLQKLLLVRAEMLSGAPTRGTELTAMIYRNIQTRPTRNLMIFGQHVTLLCQYSKMTAQMGHDKLIPHGLDAITSDVLIQDLVLARPFAQLAVKICFQDQGITQLYKDLLFVNFDRKFTSEDLSAVMSKYSLPHVHYALTINPWRHIQTAWRRKLKCAVEHIVEIDETEDVEALQAGHTRRTENRIYGLSAESLVGAAEDVLPLFLQASTSWQEHCKVPPGGRSLPYNQARTVKEPTRGMHKSTTTYASKPTMVEDIVNKVVERLTPMLTELMQAITNAPRQARLSHRQREKQRRTDSTASEDIRKEETDSAEEKEEDTDLQTAIQASLARPPAGESSTSRRRLMPEMSLEQQALSKMRELLQREDLEWKSSQQRDAMNTVLQGQTDIVVIMPTGGGKSMLAIIPSLLEDNKTTVLVLPLNSLIMDYERKLQGMRVPYQIYTPNKKLNPRDNLVIVSADKSQTAQWRSTLADHAHHKMVARMVIDEAHIPLTTKGYRKSLEHFYDIRSEPVPLVLLTATLPPSLMPALRETYQLVSNASIHRQGTNRAELRFVLEKT
ncbi:hypothetical protein L210DRAFT_3427928, partial [Boletus edulis BED1]